MAKTEEWFGISSSAGPLSLKYRMLAELVWRLTSMAFQRDDHDKELYSFTSKNGRIFVRVAHKRGHENYYYLVEILDDSKNVLISEKIYWAGSPSTIGHHPFCELIELVKGEYLEYVVEIQKINRLLDILT